MGRKRSNVGRRGGWAGSRYRSVRESFLRVGVVL